MASRSGILPSFDELFGKEKMPAEIDDAVRVHQSQSAMVSRSGILPSFNEFLEKNGHLLCSLMIS